MKTRVEIENHLITEDWGINFKKMYQIAIAILCFILLLSCAKKTEMEQENIFTYPEDSVQLEKIISVHEKPLETQWSRFVLNAHFNETGIAMLVKFDKKTLEKIRASAQELPYQATAISASAIRHWFPEHLKSQFILHSNGETYSLNYPIYSVENMLRKPFNNGFAFFYKEYIFIYGYTL